MLHGDFGVGLLLLLLLLRAPALRRERVNALLFKEEGSLVRVFFLLPHMFCSTLPSSRSKSRSGELAPSVDVAVLEDDVGMDIFWTPKSEMCPKCAQKVSYVQNVTKTCLKVHNVSKMCPTWLKIWSHFGNVFEK